MPKEIKANISGISNLEIKSKLTEDKDGNRDIVSIVKFECESFPGEFNDILIALRNGHQVDVLMASNQPSLVA